MSQQPIEWRNYSWTGNKTVKMTGIWGPYNADLQLAFTEQDRITGRRQSGTSGAEFAVGGEIDGEDFTYWIVKDQPASQLDPGYWAEYSGSFTTDERLEATGTWVDIHGNEGDFTMTEAAA
ncbi:MAG: hypothetical protein AAF567_22905 [Actinomycetota bacterium]